VRVRASKGEVWQKIHSKPSILPDALYIFYITQRNNGGAGSSVDIVTDYGLEGPGSNPGGDEIFRPSRPALGPTQPPVQWVQGLSWG
jgi:hypothetical protein